MNRRAIIAAGLAAALPQAAATEAPRQKAKAEKPAKIVAKLAPMPIAAPQADPVTGLSFVRLPAACYPMGSPGPVLPRVDSIWKHIGYQGTIDTDERPVHEVCVDAFVLGQTEVTAAAWLRVMGTPPPLGGGLQPAAGVSWLDVQRFLEKLNAGAAGPRYRLPTEAEWEYACRAGAASESPRAVDELIDGAWYASEKRRRSEAAEVAKLPANAWGLHDMLGNVWEWTADAYRADAYGRHLLHNPRVDGDATADRVLRGASFRSEYLQVRCAARSSYPTDQSLPQIGLRLVRIE